MSDNHSNIRDEQFWFTATVVGFNAVIIGAEQIRLPVWFVIAASWMVSLFGAHLILTRWLAASGRSNLDRSFDNARATPCQRGCYTWGEIRSYLRDFPYVIMELSGTLFYLLLMAMTFAGVIYRVLT
jgi:hypothetical protein